ncbi:MAG: hypothetical protein ACLGI8_10210 [Acidimicrobiia bacterium]
MSDAASDPAAVIRLRVPAEEDYVSLLRATVRVLAGRVGCSDDARSRLQAGVGRAFFALLEDAATVGATATLTVTWDEDRVVAEVICQPAPTAPVLTSIDSHHDVADGHELVDGGRGVRLWVAVEGEER